MRDAGPVLLRSVAFRREREPIWRELEALLDVVQRRGLRALTAAQLTRLPHLYRATLSSLGVARSISLDRNVVDYLESLAARAYLCVHGTRRPVREVIAGFFAVRFPAGLRRFKWCIALAALFLVLGALAGWFLTVDDPERFYTLVGDAYDPDRSPSSSTAELRAALYRSSSATDVLADFSATLFTDNARVGLLAFALGFALGVPVFLLLFGNGLVLGAYAALYHARGLSADLWGWVLPHGITELLAVSVCGGLGLALARSLILPGRFTRLRNLAACGREAGVVIIGAVLMFLVAGVIEGIFRQTVTSMSVRYTVAAVSLAAWALYIGLAGRASQQEHDG